MLYWHHSPAVQGPAFAKPKIAEGGINLSKLQSFPIPGSDFKYSFHADMEFETVGQFEQVIEQIKPLTEEVKIYGVYRRGLWK